MDQHAHQSDSRLTNAPDLLPPLMPPKPAHSSEHHRSRVDEAVVESEAGPSSSLSSRSTNDRPTPVTQHPNLTTEAEEERRFLQGDFGKKNADAPTRPRRRRRDASSKNRSRDPTKAAKGLRERVLHMTPSWFSVTMGTGVIATLLNLLPWPSIHGGLRYPAAVWLVGDMILFIIFTAGFLARYILYPQVLPLTIKHPQKSMFLGTFPMGLMVIISGICQLGTNEFGLGLGPALAASGLWWFATFISILTAIGVPFMVTTYQSHSFSSTTAALLLPIVPPITAAATGSVIAQALMVEYPTYAFTIVIVSYMVLGVGLPMALLILVLYFQRLLLFKQPPREVIISVFLPLGPCGQGGEALLHLGQVAYALFPTISAPSPQSSFSDAFDQTNTAELTLPVGQALFGAGLLGALMLWALGMWWFMLGIATLLRELKRGRLTFNMGWWGATFPLGSLAICTARLGLVLDSLTLKIVYTALTILTLAVWFTVAIPTAIGFFDGTLLSRKAAPCIADLPLDPLKRDSDDEAEEHWGEELDEFEEEEQATARGNDDATGPAVGEKAIPTNTQR